MSFKKSLDSIIWKGERQRNFTVEKLENHYLKITQMIKSNINGDKSC